MPDAPPDAPRAPWVDRWIDPARRPDDRQGLRRARTVVSGGVLMVSALLTLVVALVIGGAPAGPVALGAAGAALVAGALALVRWGGHVRAAAWLITLVFSTMPVLQSAFDVGIRDPSMGLVLLAPLAGAMMAGGRLATVAAAVGSAGAFALWAAGVRGLGPEPFSTPDGLAAYALVTVVGGSVLSALAGALYVHHTRRELGKVEGQTTRLDAALRDSEARYQSLFDGVPVGMYRTSPDGRVLLANAALARMVGAATPEAAVGLDARALYADPADRGRFRQRIDRDGSVRRFETRWARPEGGVRYVRIDAQAERDAAGRPVYYEGVVRDVTAEREAREALYRNEARFRALVQRSSDVVLVIDRDGLLQYVSPAVERLLGYRAEDLTGRPGLGYVHPDDRERARAAVRGAGRGRTGPPQVEVRVRHADGHHLFVEGVGKALFDDPAVGGLVVNVRDATERRRAQAALVEAKRQAEEVAALKSAFLANMSHEIRTPLTAILGFADVLAEEVEGEHQREFVGLIARSGRRLMDTLNSVLELARLEAGRGELASVRIDVGALVAESVDMFRPAAADRGLALVADVDGADGPVEAVLDEPALARVLHNLIGNALKFTESGGVTVAARRVEAEAGPAVAGPAVVVEVRDTGVGIDPAFLPRLFGEFEQESSGAARTHEGVGLGLAISRQLVERMGGTIGVTSEKGAGTTFTLAFPAAGAAPPDDRRPLALVIDDNDQARDVAALALSGSFRVTEAADAAGALDAVERERPDAVVLDIHLGPEVSGEAVMRRLREAPGTAGLPIVAVTAFALPGDRGRFLATGFDAYVTKPYTRETLLNAVEGAVRARGGAPGPGPEGGAFVARKRAAPADAALSDAAPAASEPEG
jgi:PAS domain S-box-containing protein